MAGGSTDCDATTYHRARAAADRDLLRASGSSGQPCARSRDPADNQFMWRWDNVDPFGANLPNENPSGQGTFKYPLGFPAVYHHSETSTHYNYFRDYDPNTGRYEQSDPIGLRDGMNTFAYAQGRPLGVLDRYGLDTFACTRPLEGSHGIRFGPLYHQYLCTWDDRTGAVTCGGLGPSGSMFGSAGVIEPDRYEPTRCELIEPNNPCYESCVRRELAATPPEYDVRAGYPTARSGAEQCQVFARRIIQTCRGECRR